jgi:hypothetical protein
MAGHNHYNFIYGYATNNLQMDVYWWQSGNNPLVLEVGKNGVAGYTCSGFNLTSDRWYHIAATIDTNQNAFLYINGTFACMVNLASAGVVNGTNFGIGSYFAAGYYTKGEMDEFGIWDTNLSEAAIATSYNNGNGLAYEIYIPEIDTLKWKEYPPNITAIIYTGLSSIQLNTTNLNATSYSLNDTKYLSINDSGYLTKSKINNTGFWSIKINATNGDLVLNGTFYLNSSNPGLDISWKEYPPNITQDFELPVNVQLNITGTGDIWHINGTGTTINNSGYYVYNLATPSWRHFRVWVNDTYNNNLTGNFFINLTCEIPAYSCDIHNNCNSSNIRSCANVTDSRCGLEFTGNITDYDLSCNYYSLYNYDLTSTNSIIILFIIGLLWLGCAIISLTFKNFIFGSFTFFLGIILGFMFIGIAPFVTLLFFLLNILFFMRNVSKMG